MVKSAEAESMFIIMPFHPLLFKRKSMCKALEIMAKMRVISYRDLMRVGFSKKGAWLMLRDLIRAEYLEAAGGGLYRVSERIQRNAILINPRDEAAGSLLRRKEMNMLLFWLIRGKKPSQISREVGISFETVKRSLSDLRRAGLIAENRVKDDFLFEPADPLDLVPRRAHRDAIKKFLEKGLSELRGLATLVLFGDASWGRCTSTLDILGLTRASSADEDAEIAEVCASSAREVLSEHGVQINLFFAPIEAWVALKHGFASGSAIMSQALNGIIFYGAEPSLKDYTERMFEFTTRDRMLELTLKGYVKRGPDGVTLTEKAIKRFRREPVNLIETKIKVNGKDVTLISVKSS